MVEDDEVDGGDIGWSSSAIRSSEDLAPGVVEGDEIVWVR